MVGVGCLDLGSLRCVRWCLISCGFGVLVACVSECVGFAGVVIWCFGIECGGFDFGGWGWFVGLWFGLGWLDVTVLGGGSGLGGFVLWAGVGKLVVGLVVCWVVCFGFLIVLFMCGGILDDFVVIWLAWFSLIRLIVICCLGLCLCGVVWIGLLSVFVLGELVVYYLLWWMVCYW